MTEQEFKDDDFVYVDPAKRLVISLVDWDKDGNALEKEWPYELKEKPEVQEDDGRKRRKPRLRYYPWGSYRSMCKLYKLKGKLKDKDTEDYIPLEDAISKLQENPYWD